jgi:hypothetical protein
MKKLLALFMFTALFSSPAHPSGLGWYLQSFDWKKYDADKVSIDSSVSKCIALGGEDWHWCGEREIVTRFIGTREQKATYLTKYDVKDVIPKNFEFFAVPLFSDAYEIQAKKNTSTYFGLFKNGRTEWKGQWTGCDAYPEMSWDCTNSYVLMKPNEVQSFKKEIDSLAAKKSVYKYEYFQQDLAVLKTIVDSAAENNRALLFYVTD